LKFQTWRKNENHILDHGICRIHAPNSLLAAKMAMVVRMPVRKAIEVAQLLAPKISFVTISPRPIEIRAHLAAPGIPG
jgi:hypothetical protein